MTKNKLSSAFGFVGNVADKTQNLDTPPNGGKETSMSSIVNVDLNGLVSALCETKFRVDPQTGDVLVGKSGAPLKRGLLRFTIQQTDDPAPRKGDKGKITRIRKGGLELNPDTTKDREKLGLPPLGGGPRTWGERIDGTPVVTHKGGYYVTARPTTPETGGAVGVPMTTKYVYTNGGGTVPSEEVRRIVFCKADGVTPLKSAPKSGYWEWSIAKMDSVKLTVDGITHAYNAPK